MSSFFNIKTVYLLLGSACNFHCKHCMQSGFSAPRIKKQITDETLKYLKELGSPRGEENKIKLIFFGGEPLLYKYIVKDVVDYLGTIFNYTIISNGSLLTCEDVDWLNKHNITFVISNDGRQTNKIRDINVLEDSQILHNFLKIKNRGIEIVHHTFSQDLYDVVHYIEEKCPNTPYYLDNLYCTDNVCDSLVDLDLNIAEQSSIKLVKEFMENFKVKTFSPATNLILPMIDKIEEHIDLLTSNDSLDLNLSTISCGAASSHLNIDLQGNIYYCHNNGEKVGTIFEDYSNIRYKINEYFKAKQSQNIKDKNCLSCDIAILCKGSCPLETNKKLFLNGCNFKKIRWKLAFDVLGAIQKLVQTTKSDLLK